jgi:hypothetical protein
MTSSSIAFRNLGGVGRRVTVDECLFRGRRKYHRGRFLLGDVDAENEADRSLIRYNYCNSVLGPWIAALVGRKQTTCYCFMLKEERRDVNSFNHGKC